VKRPRLWLWTASANAGCSPLRRRKLWSNSASRSLSLGADGDKIRGDRIVDYFEGVSIEAAAGSALAAA